MIDAAEYLEARADSATAYLRPFVRPLMTLDRHGEPDPAGSGVLLWHRGQRYLISAAHVFDVFQTSALLLGTDSKWKQLTGQYRASPVAPGARRESDSADFAFLPVSEMDAGELDGCQFLTGSQTLLRETVAFDPPRRSKYLAIGYPINRFNFDRKHNATVPLLGRVISTTATREEYAAHRRSPETHVLMQLEHKGAHARGGTLGRLPKLEGMSGGALATMPAITRLADPSPPRLVGLVTEYWAAHDLLVGIRIDIVLNAIEAAA
ncbi:MAG: hypothetical protein ABR998_10530 [Gemmatimonadales bacterium]|jgi:hypothetical protein